MKATVAVADDRTQWLRCISELTRTIFNILELVETFVYKSQHGSSKTHK